MACGDLIRSSVLNCQNILQGGVGGDSRLVLILRKDIDSYTVDVNGQITAITLAANKSGYSFDGILQSLKPKFEITKNGNGQTVYKHTAEYFYFEYNQIAKNNLRQMGNGRYVAIYENAKSDTDAFELLGKNVGLQVAEGGRSLQENNGAMRIVLSSPENEFEAEPPVTIGGASYTAIKTIVDGVLYLPTITSGGLSVTAASAAGGTVITITGTNFFGGGVNSAVLSVQYINQSTGSVVNNVTYGAVTGTTQAVTTPAMAAGTYKVRITTTKGSFDSPQNLIVT